MHYICINLRSKTLLHYFYYKKRSRKLVKFSFLCESAVYNKLMRDTNTRHNNILINFYGLIWVNYDICSHFTWRNYESGLYGAYECQTLILCKVLDFSEEQKLLCILGDRSWGPLSPVKILGLLLVGAKNGMMLTVDPKMVILQP